MSEQYQEPEQVAHIRQALGEIYGVAGNEMHVLEGFEKVAAWEELGELGRVDPQEPGRLDYVNSRAFGEVTQNIDLGVALPEALTLLKRPGDAGAPLEPEYLPRMLSGRASAEQMIADYLRRNNFSKEPFAQERGVMALWEEGPAVVSERAFRINKVGNAAITMFVLHVHPSPARSLYEPVTLHDVLDAQVVVA